ncbi:MAG: 3-phosphoshikimate 1-carboxyvinyltransferase [candidate division NC10 bacterium]|nr:3-phosphoshikimate 1-carboxyvinyltransferase [candidate division NC10 bacterium]
MGALFRCRKSTLRGEVQIPASKSHTIRAVAIASLAAGESTIVEPLESQDTWAAVEVYGGLGAEIERGPDSWRVRGTAGDLKAPEDVLDVANSGTTLMFALGSCALLKEGAAVLTGDAQTRRRSADPLLSSLNDLGARAFSTRSNGKAPFVVGGRLRGGHTSMEAHSSQYLSSLLLNAPLADGETRIQVPLLNEQPYVLMTMDWMRSQGISFEEEGLRQFRIPGGQAYRPFCRKMAGDFSSATFFLAAGALEGNEVICCGLDAQDSQGDKAVVDYLRLMGARVEVGEDRIRVRPGELRGADLDLNSTPDALPMMAVLACFAQGKSRLYNVPQARIKETDRIAVMCRELREMGASIEELPDGLVIEGSPLRGARVRGHGDHRVVMALAVAGLGACGETEVDTAEAVAVTFPQFAECMRYLGANMEVVKEEE